MSQRCLEHLPAVPVSEGVVRVSGYTGCCFLFCTRAAFETVGALNDATFAAEDLVFIRAVRWHGRFVFLRQPVFILERNLRAYSFWRIAKMLAPCAPRPCGRPRRRAARLVVPPLPREAGKIS